MSPIPQYATSTDAKVIAAIEANLAGRRAFHQRCVDFSAKYGTDPKNGFIPYHLTGRWDLAGIVGDKPTDGQWTTAVKGRAWRPAKRNPIYAEMTAITHTNAPVPGISAAYEGQYTSSGAQQILSPQVFVQDGAAWFHLTGIPHEDQTGMWGDGTFDTNLWTEVLGSQWHAAHEAKNGVQG